MSKVGGFKKAMPTAKKGITIGAQRAVAQSKVPAPPPPASNYAKTPAHVPGKAAPASNYAKTPAHVPAPPPPSGKKESPYGVPIPVKGPASGKKESPYGVPIPVNAPASPKKPDMRGSVSKVPAPPPPKGNKPKPSGSTVINMSGGWQNSSKAAKVLGTGKASADGGIGPGGTYNTRGGRK